MPNKRCALNNDLRLITQFYGSSHGYCDQLKCLTNEDATYPEIFLFTLKSALSGHYHYFWRVLQITTVLHNRTCTSDHDLEALIDSRTLKKRYALVARAEIQ